MRPLEFGGGRPRKVEGGGLYRVEEEYNLELENRPAIKAIQDALVTAGSFQLLAVTELLGITDRLVHKQALGCCR